MGMIIRYKHPYTLKDLQLTVKGSRLTIRKVHPAVNIPDLIIF